MTGVYVFDVLVEFLLAIIFYTAIVKAQTHMIQMLVASLGYNGLTCVTFSHMFNLVPPTDSKYQEKSVTHWRCLICDTNVPLLLTGYPWLADKG